jgi:ribonuclease P protein component
MKTGIKISGKATVLYLQRDESLTHARFGFIVSKSVGGAIKRNLVKRRLRSVAREIVSTEPSGYNAVIRALPEAAGLDWNRLQQEVLSNAKAAFNK